MQVLHPAYLAVRIMIIFQMQMMLAEQGVPCIQPPLSSIQPWVMQLTEQLTFGQRMYDPFLSTSLTVCQFKG